MTKKRKQQRPKAQLMHNSMTRPIPHWDPADQPGSDEPDLVTTTQEESYLGDGELFRPRLFLIPE